MEREAKVGVFRRNYEQEQTRPESLLLLQPIGSELPLKVIAYGPPSGLPPPPAVTIPKPIATADSLA